MVNVYVLLSEELFCILDIFQQVLLGPGQHWENQQFKKRHLEKLESESETNKTNCVNEEKMFRLSQDF